jgi:hypothetical protein
MSGTKYVLKNNTTLVQIFDYKSLSDAMWHYQVKLNPGQIKTIWAENNTLKIYNNRAITIESQLEFPRNNTISTVRDYIIKTLKSTGLGNFISEQKINTKNDKLKELEEKREEKRNQDDFSDSHEDDDWTY